MEPLHQFQDASMDELENGWVPNIPRGSEEEEDGAVPRSIALNMDEFSYLVETILSFHRCLKDPYSLLGDDDSERLEQFNSFSTALSQLLTVLVHGVRRFEGSNEWRIRKIVELSHFLPDIIQYGCADGFNTSTGERNLKAWAKKPSNTAQKRSAEIHSKQTASRLNETFILQQALLKPSSQAVPDQTKGDHLSDSKPKDKLDNLGKNSETFFLDTNTGQLTKKPGAKRTVESHKKPLSTVALEWFQGEFEGESGPLIQIFTEVYIKGELCRVHANFRDGGPWYDCATMDNEQGESIPCRLAAIWLDQTSSLSKHHRLMVLVQKPTRTKANHLVKADRQSQLFSHLELHSSIKQGSDQAKAVLQKVPLEELQWRTLCIDTNMLARKGTPDPFVAERGSQKAFEVLWTNRDDWPNKFMNSPSFAKRIGVNHSSRRSGGSNKRKKTSR